MRRPCWTKNWLLVSWPPTRCRSASARKVGLIPKDFSNALQRFQADAHEVIKLLNDRLNDMRSQENFDLVKNLVNRSHDMVDIAVELVNGSAEIATQLANSPIVKQNLGRRAGRKR